FDAGRTKTAVSVLRDFAKQGHQLLVFTCHAHVRRTFADVKVYTGRNPNRYNKNETIDVPGVAPEPVGLVPGPAPLPEPMKQKTVNATKPEPEPVVVAVEDEPEEPEMDEEPEIVVESRPAEIVVEYDPKPAPVLPSPAPPAEVEYWWDARQAHGEHRQN